LVAAGVVAVAAWVAAVLLPNRGADRPPGPSGGRTEEALATFGFPSGEAADPISWAAGQHPVLADLLPAMTRLTVTPTGLETFEPSNVIPPFVDLTCDCRALAGQSESEIRDHVHAALGNDFGYEVELLEPLAGGTESEIDTPLYELIAEYVDQRLGARLLPFVSPGFSDSHWVRRGYGTVAYGFAPVFHTDPDEYMRGAHGADEAIEVSDLVEMAEFHLHALNTLGG
ncbi:MAG: hypothetical protein ACRDK1_04485, partial [Solirubrobacterales bacterium]